MNKTKNILQSHKKKLQIPNKLLDLNTIFNITLIDL